MNTNGCAVALKVRSRFSMLQANIEAFTGEKPKKKTTGTDVLGTIKKLEDVSRNANCLSRYNSVRLIFVSDMIHQTNTADFKTKLAGMPSGNAVVWARSIQARELDLKNRSSK